MQRQETGLRLQTVKGIQAHLRTIGYAGGGGGGAGNCGSRGGGQGGSFGTGGLLAAVAVLLDHPMCDAGCQRQLAALVGCLVADERCARELLGEGAVGLTAEEGGGRGGGGAADGSAGECLLKNPFVLEMRW